MRTWKDIPKVREETWHRGSCEFSEHTWERFDFEMSGETYAIAVLCTICGRDPEEAIANLPIVVPPAIYPPPIWKR